MTISMKEVYKKIKIINLIFILNFQKEFRPKRTFWNLVRLALVGFGIETLFSMQEALAVPLLLKLRVPEQYFINYSI